MDVNTLQRIAKALELSFQPIIPDDQLNSQEFLVFSRLANFGRVNSFPSVRLNNNFFDFPETNSVVSSHVLTGM